MVMKDVAHCNGIHSSQVRRWKSQEQELKQRLKDGQSNHRHVSGGGGRPLYGKEIGDALRAFVSKRHDHSLAVTSTMLMVEWRRIDPEIKEKHTQGGYPPACVPLHASQQPFISARHPCCTEFTW